MKTYTARALAAIVISVLLASYTRAQSEFSPRFGIAYSDAGGFTRKPARWIDKRKAKSERRHGPAIAAAFEQNMRELQSFEDFLDAGWSEVRAEFAQCNDVSRLSPASIRVWIEAGPFAVAGYDKPISGVAYQDGTLVIVYWNLREDAGPQFAAALYKGELRNWVWWKLHGSPREMWGRDACSPSQ
jgi:hypothetical protein